MATEHATTNVVSIMSSPRVQERVRRVLNPEPLCRTPELAVMVAILYAMSAKQRAAVKGALFRKSFDNPGDENLARAYHHIGRTL